MSATSEARELYVKPQLIRHENIGETSPDASDAPRQPRAYARRIYVRAFRAGMGL